MLSTYSILTRLGTDPICHDGIGWSIKIHTSYITQGSHIDNLYGRTKIFQYPSWQSFPSLPSLFITNIFLCKGMFATTILLDVYRVKGDFHSPLRFPEVLITHFDYMHEVKGVKTKCAMGLKLKLNSEQVFKISNRVLIYRLKFSFISCQYISLLFIHYHPYFLYSWSEQHRLKEHQVPPGVCGP